MLLKETLGEKEETILLKSVNLVIVILSFQIFHLYLVQVFQEAQGSLFFVAFIQ